MTQGTVVKIARGIVGGKNAPKGAARTNNVYIKLKNGAVYKSLQEVSCSQHKEIHSFVQANGSCPNVSLNHLWQRM